jgi:hypothetical protein
MGGHGNLTCLAFTVIGSQDLPTSALKTPLNTRNLWMVIRAGPPTQRKNVSRWLSAPAQETLSC